MPHISLSNLTIAYGDHQVLKNITVDIPDGQITVIIGPSGCGKTTLLKSLNRLTDLYEEIRSKERSESMVSISMIRRADILALRKKVGFLSQKPFPFPCPFMTILPSDPEFTGWMGSNSFTRSEKSRNIFPSILHHPKISHME